jgi:hypothetical protein
MRHPPPPGTIISIAVWPVDHVGIVTDRFVDGSPTIISNSLRRGGVVEETWQSFHAGLESQSRGYPGRLLPSVVLKRARSKLGSKWTPTSNCEHLVRYAHGLPVESPQLQKMAFWSLIIGLVFIVVE